METQLLDESYQPARRGRAARVYRSFESARRLIAAIRIKDRVMFKKWGTTGIEGKPPRPKDIPANPKKTYRTEWKGWGFFLSKPNSIRKFLRDHNKGVLRELAEHPIDRVKKSDEAYVQWIRDEQTKGWVFIKFDVTFAASGDSPSEDFWRDYYYRRVIPDVRVFISDVAEMNELIAEYEFGIHGQKRQDFDERKPHHIHAILGLKCAKERAEAFARRIVEWANDEKRSKALSSVYAAVIPDNDDDVTKTVRKAFYYMRKGKYRRTLN